MDGQYLWGRGPVSSKAILVFPQDFVDLMVDMPPNQTKPNQIFRQQELSRLPSQ